MAQLDATYPTLLDFAKRHQPDGSGIADIVEMLAQQSPVARGGYVEMCNNGTSHETTLRASIPSPTWVQFYSRITPVKSTTTQVTDTTGMAEGLTQVDARLKDVYGDTFAQYRMTEATAVVEGFAQEMEQTFFYGNTGTAPLEFLGLAPRMNSTTGLNARNVITAGGAGSDNTSIYLCTWGPSTGHLLVPEGVPTGLQREDMGRVRSETTAGVMWVYEELFKQHLGFTMRDWRYFARICNIDVSNLTTGSAADLVDLIITAYYRLPNRKSTTGFAPGSGQPIKITPVIYCNSTIKEILHKQLLRQPNGFLRPGEYFGEEVEMCMSMPILETDAIVNTETLVS